MIKKHLAFYLCLALIFGVSGCNFFAPPADLQTENLQSDLARTQIADIRQTATVGAERLLITAEFAVNAVRNADEQSTRIVSTLIAQGTPFVEPPALALLPIQTIGGTPIPDAQIQIVGSAPPVINNPLITPGGASLGGGSVRVDSTLLPPSPTSLVPQQNNPNAPALLNVQISTSVGADDCAVNPTTSFSVGVTDIYVVAVASNILATNVLSSRWLREGTEVAFYDWTPGFAVNGNCIWFNLPSSSVDILPGNWTVQMAIDSIPVGNVIAFTVSSS